MPLARVIGPTGYPVHGQDRRMRAAGVREDLRTRHYSHRTEKGCVAWIGRHVPCHANRHRVEMGGAEVAPRSPIFYGRRDTRTGSGQPIPARTSTRAPRQTHDVDEEHSSTMSESRCRIRGRRPLLLPFHAAGLAALSISRWADSV